MTDEQFAIRKQYIKFRSEELRSQGDRRSDLDLFMAVLQSDWDTLSNEATMQRFSRIAQLGKLTGKRTALDAERPALDAEILRLEGIVGEIE